MVRYLNLLKNVSNWWLHFSVKYHLTDTDPLLFKARNNIIIEVPRVLHHEFKEIFMEECYTRGLKRKIPENPIVIDIGANVGFFSLFAASRFPGARIFAYEPIENNFKQLFRNRELNVDIKMICEKKAVYDNTRMISLHLDPEHRYTTSASVLTPTKAKETTIHVPCIAFSEILDAHNLTHCDLLKMDCEGSEFAILYNCPKDYLSRIQQLVIEVHQGTEPGHSMSALTDFLKKAGFGMRQSGYMLWAWNKTALTQAA